MANSNKACRGVMTGVDSRSQEQQADASKKRAPELWEVMEKVSRGELSVEEAVKQVNSLNGESNDCKARD